MKKYGTLIALAVAVIFGIAAVILANKWLSTQAVQEKVVFKEQVPLGKIVIAGKDMTMGASMTKESLTLADWPKANIPPGAFTDVKELEGRVAVTRITAGMPIVSAELAAPGSGAGLVALIDPGMRAMAIQVNEVIGVGGFILPNTFVDVISVQGEGAVARTVLKNIEVLAVAQETFVEEGQARLVRTVTLEIDPKQAEKLAETTHKGPIHLVLRNPAEDEEPPKPEPKRGSGKKVARKYVPPKQYDTFKMELVQGDNRPENYTFKYEKK